MDPINERLQRCRPQGQWVTLPNYKTSRNENYKVPETEKSIQFACIVTFFDVAKSVVKTEQVGSRSRDGSHRSVHRKAIVVSLPGIVKKPTGRDRCFTTTLTPASCRMRDAYVECLYPSRLNLAKEPNIAIAGM